MEHEERPETASLTCRQGVLADDGAAALNCQATAELDSEGSVARVHPASLTQVGRKESPLGWRYGFSRRRGSARVSTGKEFAVKVVRCSCGVEMRSRDEGELIRQVQEHARDVHDVTLSEEQVRAMMEIDQ
jgi:predicted small metal-binding protein